MLRFTLFVLFSLSLAASAQQPALPPRTQSSAPQSSAPQSSAPESSTPAAPDSATPQLGPAFPAPEILAAESAIAAADWKTAETSLNLWLASHPTDPRALFDAGYTADAQNRPDDAEKLYRRALDADPKSFEAHVSLGLLLARQGNTDDARPELALATQLDPPTDQGQAGPAAKARAYRALARIDKTDNPEDASDELLEALKLSPETPADTLLAAAIADQAGEFPAAEAAYRRVLTNTPNSAPAHAGLAHVLIAEKQYPDAETHLRAALKSSPDDPVLNAELAVVLVAQDKAEAIPVLQKLHDAHPKNTDITRMLASVLSDSGDYSGSDHYYLQVLAATPSDAAALIGHGQNLIRILRFPDAFAAFDKATQIDPSNPDGWSGLAFAASKTSHPDVALHALTMRSKYLPEVPSTYFLWAISYDSLHKNSEAAAYYQHFLDAAAGKYPDQEWQARQRLKLLTEKH